MHARLAPLQADVRFGGKKALPIGISNDSSGGVLVQDCEDCLVFLGVELEVNAVGRNFRLILAEGGHAS
jgi:hypothetical protein